MLNFEEINKRLAGYAEDYGKKYPRYKELEFKYIKEFDRLLMEAQASIGNQPSREAYARQEVSNLDFYDEFVSLQVEVNVIRTQISILKQISENLKTEGFREIRMGGGDYYGK